MLSNNLKKQKAEQRLAEQKKSDLVLYKLMISFMIAVFGVCGMLSIGKSLSSEAAFRTYALTPMMILGGVLTAGAAVYFALQRSRHVDESRKIITSTNMLGLAIVFFGCCVYYKMAFDATQVVIIMICAIVLYFVYNIFRPDFFLCSVSAAAGIILTKMATFSAGTIFGRLLSTAATILGFVVPVLFLVLTLILAKNKGKISRFTLLEKGDHLYPIIITSVIALVGAVLALVMPAAAVYAIIALLVAYLALAVAYTIKMM